MKTADIFRKFKLENPQLLGKGGEGEVYALDDERVLKVYGGSNLKYLQELTKFQNLLTSFSLPFATPQILEFGETTEVCYAVEIRLPGENLDNKFSTLSDQQRLLVLTRYFAAMRAFNAESLNDRPFGQVLTVGGSVQANTWPDFLLAKLNQQIDKSRIYLTQDVNEFEQKEKLLKDLISTKTVTEEKRLVHADYYLNNVLVDDDLNISAVLDFSIHCVAGDPRLDTASIIFLGLNKDIKPSQIELFYEQTEERYGKGIRQVLGIYGMYYSIYYAGTHDQDPNSYQWCLNNLNNEKFWESF